VTSLQIACFDQTDAHPAAQEVPLTASRVAHRAAAGTPDRRLQTRLPSIHPDELVEGARRKLNDILEWG
jgi:hypothetical protein